MAVIVAYGVVVALYRVARGMGYGEEATSIVGGEGVPLFAFSPLHPVRERQAARGDARHRERARLATKMNKALDELNMEKTTGKTIEMRFL